jgi:uncharacterized surface protein with fasciclin (FAS1) repeats
MKNPIWRLIKGSSKVLLVSLLLFGCDPKVDKWEVQSEDLVISDYVAAHSEFSEFAKLLEITGLDHLLAVRGPFTLFLPSNEVMQEYYASMGVSSYTEFTDPTLVKKLVYNHLVANDIKTSEIGLGAIRDTNALGDFLVTEFQGSDIIINKQSKIIKRDIRAANGYIQLIDKVIDPVTTDIYSLIAANPALTIFAQGLDTTHLKDTLQDIYFMFGSKPARTRFTVFPVPDTIFHRYGINNIGDLIARYTNAADSVTFLENGFYRYMEYHCLGGTFYLSDFTTKLYPILSSDNNISVTIDTDYKLNFSKADKTYTGLIVEESNYNAKNGTYHVIRDLLPVVQPDPTKITWDVCSYFDMQQGDYYKKYYMKWFQSTLPDGTQQFAKITWEGDYLQYYYKNHDAPVQINFDGLNMNGWWWVQVVTPKIMKGHYTLSGYIWGGPQYNCYVDGVLTAHVITGDNPELGEFVWDKTEEHSVRLVATAFSLIFWDTLVFTPVE